MGRPRKGQGKTKRKGKGALEMGQPVEGSGAPQLGVY